MRTAMAEAEVGDDVFGEDPTVQRLQERVASLLGKEAALFVPSGTMANEICVKVWTQPGQEVICEAGCHILNYESGAAAFLSRVQMQGLPGQRGVITTSQVASAIRPGAYYLPQTALIAIENTHNSAGGTVFPQDQVVALYELAKERKLRFHLDGARIWNAAVASGLALSELAEPCDSISVCFSKGLGAPIGSAVAGDAAFIREAHRLRKLLGGGMRQVGILAAAALHALENNIERLPEDHEHARLLANGLAELPGIDIDLDAVQTNIVIFDVGGTGRNAEQIAGSLKENGVLVVPFGPTRIRAVTHLDVSRVDIEQALKVFSIVLSRK